MFMCAQSMFAQPCSLMLEAFSLSEIGEFCERDAFEARCEEDEVIFIRYARYGRMRDGRCITNTYGVMGCSSDVRHLLDTRCGGRRKCEVIVANLVPEDAQPCPNDFRSYLEVAYQCVKGNNINCLQWTNIDNIY